MLDRNPGFVSQQFGLQNHMAATAILLAKSTKKLSRVDIERRHKTVQSCQIINGFVSMLRRFVDYEYSSCDLSWLAMLLID